MTIAKIFRELPLIPNVEIVTALLPEVFRLANQSSNRSIDQSINRRETPCFYDLSASASLLCCGSPMSRWTCSGITQRAKLRTAHKLKRNQVPVYCLRPFTHFYPA